MLALRRRPAGADGPARHHRRLHRFREEVITGARATSCAKARERAHILVGLALAVVNLDEIIKLIRAAADPAVARERLIAAALAGRAISARWSSWSTKPGPGIVDGHYRLSEEQAKAILELRLQRLTGLERDKIAQDLQPADRSDRRPDRHPRFAQAHLRDHARRAPQDAGGFRRHAPHDRWRKASSTRISRT